MDKGTLKLLVDAIEAISWEYNDVLGMICRICNATKKEAHGDWCEIGQLKEIIKNERPKNECGCIFCI